MYRVEGALFFLLEVQKPCIAEKAVIKYQLLYSLGSSINVESSNSCIIFLLLMGTNVAFIEMCLQVLLCYHANGRCGI